MSVDTVVGYVFSFIISPVVGYLLGALTERVKRSRQADSAIEAGVRVLLGDKLLEIWLEAKERSNISIEKLAMARDVYQMYHNLGGNGLGTERMLDLEKIPHEEDIT